MRCFGLLLLTLVGCTAPTKPESQADTKTPLETIEAEVVTLQLFQWPTIVRSHGSLYADEQSLVGAKVAGRVSQVHVDLGDRVTAGDPLVTLDQDEFQLQVAQAEAQLQQARSAVGLRDGDPVEKLRPENAPPVRQERAMLAESESSLKRAATLLSQNAISQGEYDLAEAAAEVADARYASALNGVHEKIATIGVREAELSLARQRLTDAVIRSPLNGFVRERQVAVGTFLAIGQPIAAIVSTHPLRFRGTVSERHAQAIAIDQRISLRIESLPQPRVAEITRVSPALDQQSRSLAFEALVDNSDHRLRTGLFVEADLVIDPDATALVVPDTSIVEFAGAEKVWKVVDGVAQEQEILTGARRDGRCEVLRGLAVGDRILVDATVGRVANVRESTNAVAIDDAPLEKSSDVLAR